MPASSQTLLPEQRHIYAKLFECRFRQNVTIRTEHRVGGGQLPAARLSPSPPPLQRGRTIGHEPEKENYR